MSEADPLAHFDAVTRFISLALKPFYFNILNF